MEKRGISPVIATVLLIAITLVAGVVIVVWARSFVGEQATKYNQPIANACGQISFVADASISGSVINVVNKADVPIYGIKLMTTGTSGSSVQIGDNIISREDRTGTLKVGETGTFPLPTEASGYTEFKVIPVILGESGGKQQYYPCDSAYEVATATA